MFCPRCGYEMECPCRDCVETENNGDVKPWIHLKGDVIKCFDCGMQKKRKWWNSLENTMYRNDAHEKIVLEDIAEVLQEIFSCE